MTPSEGTDTPPSTPDLVYNFLVKYKQAHDGNSPSLREIADACNLVISGVHYHLTRLMMEGKIVIAEQGRSRSIEIVGAAWLPPGEDSANKGECGSPQRIDRRSDDDDPDRHWQAR